MKNLILLTFIVISNICYGQNSWTTEQIQVLDKYGLNENDHRGVIFYISDKEQSQYPTLNDAILAFFNSKSVLDISRIYVNNLQGFDSIEGKTLDIHLLVDAYLQLNK